jgi:hypothetical protein
VVRHRTHVGNRLAEIAADLGITVHLAGST